MRRSMKHILLGAVMAIALFCSLGFYDQDYHVNQGIYYDDDCVVYFGTDYDFSIYSDTTGVLEFDPLTAGYTIYFGTTHTDAVNIKWFSDADGDFVTFDEENVEVLFTDVDLQLDDDAIQYYGTTNDASVNWDNTNNELDLTIASGGYHVTLSSILTGKKGFVVSATMDSGVLTTEGGAGYFGLGVADANCTGKVYGLSTWLDITGTSTPTAGCTMSPLEIGIWQAETGPDTSLATAYVLKMEFQGASDNNFAGVYWFDFSSSGQNPTAIFHANGASNCAYTANTTHTGANTDKLGAIAIKIDSINGGNVSYFYVYSHAGQ